VLEGKTKGYINHPQLTRFKAAKIPLDAINLYLRYIYEEALERNYNFDAEKFDTVKKPTKLKVTKSQLEYEMKHLLNKLKKRSKIKFSETRKIKKLKAHPLFTIVPGKIESWEKI
jgi:hypothetical protein